MSDAGDPHDLRDPAASAAATPARRVIVVGWVFAGLAALMVPWTAYVFVALPPSQRAAHYDLAWGGFDAALLGLIAATAYAAVRHSRWLPVVAGATATLLVVDAWFDVVTAAQPRELWAAVAMAALVELPLAGVCLWLAVRGQALLERRIALSVRHRGGVRHPR